MDGLNKLLATSESLATQIGGNGGVVKNLRRGVGVFDRNIYVSEAPNFYN